MIFQDPRFLWLGAGVAVIALLAIWRHASRRRKLARFLGGRAAANRLSRSDLFRAPVERVALLVAAALLIGAAAAEPRFAEVPEEPPTPPVVRSVLIAIDVSASMQASDGTPTRLAQAVEITHELLDSFAADRVGLLLFAGTAYPLAPPTHDHQVLRYLLSGLAPHVATALDPGTLVSRAISGAAAMLPPDSLGAGDRTIILIGDGESGEADARVLAAASAARDAGITIHSVGVGTARGAGMVLSRWTYQLGGQVLDSGGAPAVSRLREPLLRQIAARGSGSYVHSGDPARSLTFARLFAVPVLEPPPAPTVRDWSSYDLTFWCALAALLLLVLEALIDVRISLSWRVMQRRSA